MRLRLLMAVLLTMPMTSSLISAEARADESIVRVWKLISYISRDEETGAETKPWGEKPEGLLM